MSLGFPVELFCLAVLALVALVIAVALIPGWVRDEETQDFEEDER